MMILKQNILLESDRKKHTKYLKNWWCHALCKIINAFQIVEKVKQLMFENQFFFNCLKHKVDNDFLTSDMQSNNVNDEEDEWVGTDDESEEAEKCKKAEDEKAEDETENEKWNTLTVNFTCD